MTATTTHLYSAGSPTVFFVVASVAHLPPASHAISFHSCRILTRRFCDADPLLPQRPAPRCPSFAPIPHATTFDIIVPSPQQRTRYVGCSGRSGATGPLTSRSVARTFSADDLRPLVRNTAASWSRPGSHDLRISDRAFDHRWRQVDDVLCHGGGDDRQSGQSLWVGGSDHERRVTESVRLVGSDAWTRSMFIGLIQKVRTLEPTFPSTAFEVRTIFQWSRHRSREASID
jgi:hypothetical protein